MVMFGNGVRIGLTAILLNLLKTLLVPKRARTVFPVAGRGAAVRGSVGRHSAVSVSPDTATATSVSDFQGNSLTL